MTVGQHDGHGDPTVTVRRTEGVVLVTVGGALDPPTRNRLAQILDDLIDGQGNLFLTVELPGIDEAPVETIDVLAKAADRASARNGQLRLSPAAHRDDLAPDSPTAVDRTP